MDILQEMNHFYFKMALYELQIMNDQDYYHGLSYNSMLYINVIAQMEDCTVSKLARALYVTKSAITLKINELMKEGIVHKIQSEDDKRVFYVRLSEEMKQTIMIYDDVFQNIEKDMNKKYTKEQLHIFMQILHDMSSYEWRNIKNE